MLLSGLKLCHRNYELLYLVIPADLKYLPKPYYLISEFVMSSGRIFNERFLDTENAVVNLAILSYNKVIRLK